MSGTRWRNAAAASPRSGSMSVPSWPIYARSWTSTRREGPMYKRVGKRALDLVIALPLCILLAPVLAVLALAISVGLGRPVLFRQERPGLHGRIFRIAK